MLSRSGLIYPLLQHTVVLSPSPSLFLSLTLRKSRNLLQTSECDAALLNNGSVLVAIRSEVSTPAGRFRIQARSDDEGETFVPSSVRFVSELPDSHCQASLLRHGDALYLSHPMNSQNRINMVISRSQDEGATWDTFQTIYQGPAGYSSIATVPTAFGGAAIAIAYNRGWDGDGCAGDACPYSTVVSFAVVDLDTAATQTTESSGCHKMVHGARNKVSPGENFLFLGWYCLRGQNKSYPDAPGMFDEMDRVVVSIDSPPCEEQACPAANYTELLVAPGTAGFPQPLMNGSVLKSALELIRFGQQPGFSKRSGLFVLAESAGASFLAMAHDAACYAEQALAHTSLSTRANQTCGITMKQHAHSLCTALSMAQMDWWIIDTTVLEIDHSMLSWYALGLAQGLRAIKQTCASNYGIVLTLGLVIDADTGALRDSIISQNVRTVWEAGHTVVTKLENVVDIVDYFLASGSPPTSQSEATRHYCTNNGAAYGGECSPGRDEVVMEWTHWSIFVHIPPAKLIMGLPMSHTAVTSCPSTYRVGQELQQCMPTDACVHTNGWIGGDANPTTGQAAILDAVAAGNMTLIYDTWSQQSYFAGATNIECGGCVNWIDIGVAQSFDFALRALIWRGVAGAVSNCVDYDYTADSSVTHHWTQPTQVLTNIRRSEVYLLEAGEAAEASSGGFPTPVRTCCFRLLPAAVLPPLSSLSTLSVSLRLRRRVCLENNTVHCLDWHNVRFRPGKWRRALQEFWWEAVQPSRPEGAWGETAYRPTTHCVS